MNATPRLAGAPVVCLLAALLVLGIPGTTRAVEVPPMTQPVITSISLTGTNLYFSAWFPAGVSQAELEIRASLAESWREAVTLNVPTNGGNFDFKLPQPAMDIAFFRLNITLGSGLQPESSSQVQYVIVPPLTEILSNGVPVEAIFHFQGQIDGSDRIRITRTGACWDHVNWDWPGAVKVNDSQWNPSDKNYLTTASQTAFLPDKYSLTDVSLEVINGRDVVALERSDDALLVYLDDTPLGAGPYDFKIHFHRTKPHESSKHFAKSLTLKITAQIEGSDRLKVTAHDATWSNVTFGPPSAVTLNGIVWDLGRSSVLPNNGTNRFLPEGVDFSTAQIVRRSGRDLATMWADADALWITFADNPNGPDRYELEILLNQKDSN